MSRSSILIPVITVAGLLAASSVAGAGSARALTTVPLPAAPEEEKATPAVYRLTVVQVIEMARSASPRLNQLRLFEQAAEHGIAEAKAGRMPAIDAMAGYTWYSEIPEFRVTFPPPAGSRTIYPYIPNNYAARLAVTLPLYTGGRIGSLVDAATGEHTASSRDLEAGSADLALEAASVYWSLLTAQASERVLGEALASYDAHLMDARHRESAGIAARNEVLAVQVERERAELERLQAAHDVQVINADLVRLLNLPPGSRVEPDETLDPLSPPSEDVETLVAEALGRRPERAALVARAEAAEARVGAVRSDRRPLVNLSAGYDYARPNRRILPWEDRWEDTWDASINLTYRIFDGGVTNAAFARAEAEAAAVRMQLEDFDRRIRYEVTGRLADVGTAAAAVDVATANVESARENRRVASDRYRAGVVPSSELLDAETALIRADLERTAALSRQRLSAATLDRAVGR